MKLQGIRESDFIDFAPQDDVSQYTFIVTASLGGRIVEDDLPLLSVASFCSALHEFVATRSGEPVLEGAYDFRLALHSNPSDTSTRAEFYMAKFILQEDGDYGRLALSGCFPISQSALLAFAEPFTAHFSNEKPVPSA